jgi:hypothetical protein
MRITQQPTPLKKMDRLVCSAPNCRADVYVNSDLTNSAIERLLGWTVDERPGQTPHEHHYCPAHRSLSDRFHKPIRRVDEQAPGIVEKVNQAPTFRWGSFREFAVHGTWVAGWIALWAGVAAGLATWLGLLSK